MKSWGTLREELPMLIAGWKNRAKTPKSTLCADSHSSELAIGATGAAHREVLADCARELQVFVTNCTDERHATLDFDSCGVCPMLGSAPYGDGEQLCQHPTGERRQIYDREAIPDFCPLRHRKFLIGLMR